MSGICTENYHYPHPFFTTKRTHQEINLPPRKLLLTRHSNLPISIPEDFLTENPNSPETPKFSHNFLPYNADEDEEEDELADPYSSDDFRIYEFKVRRCMRSRSHDWTDCPFAHPGEKARRRDPRKFHYSGNSCSDFRRGSCPRGDSCEFSHGVFECWLHPARYRTQACKDGRSCKRKICFFAHTPNQLRVLPSNLMSTSPSPPSHHHHHHQQNCCVHCNSSPTSTLMGFSHLSSSPPLSPSTSEDLLLSYKSKLLMDLVSSLEAMDLSAVSSASPTTSIDGSWGSSSTVSPNYYENQDHQTQFVLSPCTSISKPRFKDALNEEDGLSNNGGGACPESPDLDWVNELVM